MSERAGVVSDGRDKHKCHLSYGIIGRAWDEEAFIWEMIKPVIKFREKRVHVRGSEFGKSSCQSTG